MGAAARRGRRGVRVQARSRRAVAYREPPRHPATTSAPRSPCRPWCSATSTTPPAPACCSPATRSTGDPRALRRVPARAARARTWSPAGSPRGRWTTSPRSAPDVHAELLRAGRHAWSDEGRDVQDIEFTVRARHACTCCSPAPAKRTPRGGRADRGRARRRGRDHSGRGARAGHRGPGPAPCCGRGSRPVPADGAEELGRRDRASPGGRDRRRGRRRREEAQADAGLRCWSAAPPARTTCTA